MSEAMNDLEKKIRNVCRDFELEHDARTGNTINVRVEVKDNVITARIVATGGPVVGGVNYIVGNGDREMIIPMTSGGITAADLPLLDATRKGGTNDPINDRKDSPNSTMPKRVNRGTSTI